MEQTEKKYRIGEEVVCEYYSPDACTLTVVTMEDDLKQITLRRYDKAGGFVSFVVVPVATLGAAKPKTFTVETEWRKPQGGELCFDANGRAFIASSADTGYEYHVLSKVTVHS